VRRPGNEKGEARPVIWVSQWGGKKNEQGRSLTHCLGSRTSRGTLKKNRVELEYSKKGRKLRRDEGLNTGSLKKEKLASRGRKPTFTSLGSYTLGYYFPKKPPDKFKRTPFKQSRWVFF